MVPKASKMTPDGSQGRLKSIKNRVFLSQSGLEVKKAIPELSGQPFKHHFESISGAKFGDFS